jgi:hypothetical protein
VVTLVTAICGVVFGFGGLSLGILNFLRDRPRLTVTLNWNMVGAGGPTFDPKKRWGLVRVTNVGRRPVYLAIVALKLPKNSKTPKGFEYSHLVLMDSVRGRSLAEGDPPAIFPVDQEQLIKDSLPWQQLWAIAEDSTGKVYESKKPPKVFGRK